jgi:hypothetical protein
MVPGTHKGGNRRGLVARGVAFALRWRRRKVKMRKSGSEGARWNMIGGVELRGRKGGGAGHGGRKGVGAERGRSETGAGRRAPARAWKDGT